MNRDFVKDVLLGVATGDAIGVPVEFRSRTELLVNPVTGMRGYGSHNQPPGTWSDDSSLTFCLGEMLCGKYDLEDLGNRFINWADRGYWTPYGVVFDKGIATASAITRLKMGGSTILAGGNEESSNGNGSLMRILPLLFLIKDKGIDERFLIIKDVSSLTHRHIRSVLACFIYLEIAMEILSGKERTEAYRQACIRVQTFLDETATCTEKEKANFTRILSGNLYKDAEDDILSSGYVIHTLEASIWCLLKTNNYKDAVLKAANLGQDTDTTAAVTGGLAGLLYGWETIPEEWLAVLAKREEIEELCRRLNKKFK
ncbi:ADP-ribosylglycohydrolase family protein [Flavitalea sp. BT771]|uniref:ADP-ribosylglycohydrolase family protein n=1 Tax=Flavitalea sp. BT771 TaxID=3063329 RepID=UPI0026E2BE24|nr:ADP-ribosylglycohydrolase family protein [Flavitalea sp. BT771]MDO6431065.1 ADP-ribosylglycohydrolase family protein [Flavitalea sp. BT771]MDV6219972.1 ADP-ribosylglycohydrolase family protein [Flavitalea sp. BT771]